MNTTAIKKLEEELNRAIEKNNLSSTGVVNYFYRVHVKDEKLQNLKKSNFLLMSDRHCTTEEKIEPKLKAKWLANNRYELTI